MSGMFDLANVLELVVNRFNQGTFTQKNLVVQMHQGVLHIAFTLGNHMNIINKQWFK